VEVGEWTRPVEKESGFGVFISRTHSVVQYMWPKNQILVRLRIVSCFGLIASGRVINLVVPLYTKWIGESIKQVLNQSLPVDALSGPNPQFCYGLILIAMGLKFLQGSGAMGGFLNTIRTLLWLGVQQYTTLSIETDVFRHLHRLPLKWHLSRKSGEVMKIIDRGTSSINDFLK
jgi:ATP-binding cassette subfamily B (MDR/TAP) protein 6